MALERSSAALCPNVSHRMVSPACCLIALTSESLSDAGHNSASAKLGTLLVPDKDADGLCATMIIYRTLIKLGLPSELISVHFVEKGSNVHTDSERGRMEAYGTRAKRVIVVDQGSRPGGPLVRGEDVRTLIVDHHWTDGRPEDYPEGALVLSAAHYPPVATSSTLSYVMCRPLIGAENIQEVDYLCAMGTFGDLGTSFGFQPAPPWPREDMQACIRRCTKKALGDAVGLLNARECRPIRPYLTIHN